MKTQSDVLITGGGMVGMSMAVALARLGLSVVVLERTAMRAQLEPEFDGRVSALALGSVRMLQAMGAWEGMRPHAEPINDIRVSDGPRPFFVHYDHEDIGDEPFGYIIENRYIRHALHQAAAALSGLHVVDQAVITECTAAKEHISVTLADGREFTASLVLAADGKQSSLREMLGIKSLMRDYQQTAIVCTIAHEKPHHGLAQERFLTAGPFAVLPMQGNRSSLVWVEPRDRVQLYLDLPKEECEQEITERVGNYLGKITLEGPRFSYPLFLTHAQRYVADRFALIGDAAHGMHPIAGQGVNLGFRDVAVLEELIRKQQAAGLDIGAAEMLAHYQRWRRFDNVSMLAVTDGLNSLFCSDLFPIKAARGLGLWSVERLPRLKRFFMKHAMGLVGDLPETFRKQSRTGFTLIELSVVLVVIAIITGMGISAGIDALESTRRVATETKLDMIEEALLNFRKRYGRLPCPADAGLATTNGNYGVEAANLGSCWGGTPSATFQTATTLVPSGAIPARTLGLPDEFMYDGWEKKFHYEVTPAMTAEDSFYHTQAASNCAITVNDNSGTALAIQPVYALVSYGKNGIGAYGKNGVAQTSGTSGTDEQTNIRSVTDAPTIRMKNAVSGAMGTSGYYDDIVRFKSLYQLLDQSQRDTVRYIGPEMLLAYNGSGSTGEILYGQQICGRFQDFSSSASLPATVSATPIFMGFTPNNAHFFAYRTASCKLYKIVGSAMSAVAAATPVPNCPAAATAGAMAQGNGMLALTTASAPYLRVWKLVGSGDAASYVELPNALVPALTDVPENISFSENGEYLAVSRHSATAYKNIYVKKADRYIALTSATQPDNGNTVYSNAISPNGRYYVSTVVSGSDTRVYLWRHINGVYTPVGGAGHYLELTGLSAPSLISFSPDSNYIAVGGTGSVTLYVVYINAAQDSMTASSAITLSATPTSVAFSPESRFLGLSLSGSGSGALALYRRSGAVSFTADTSSNLTHAAGSGSVIAFSR